jgi:hypothetical protein
LCEPKFSFLWDKCPKVQPLGDKIDAYLAFEKKLADFSRGVLPFYIPTSNV